MATTSAQHHRFAQSRKRSADASQQASDAPQTQLLQHIPQNADAVPPLVRRRWLAPDSDGLLSVCMDARDASVAMSANMHEMHRQAAGSSKGLLHVSASNALNPFALAFAQPEQLSHADSQSSLNAAVAAALHINGPLSHIHVQKQPDSQSSNIDYSQFIDFVSAELLEPDDCEHATSVFAQQQHNSDSNQHVVASGAAQLQHMASSLSEHGQLSMPTQYLVSTRSSIDAQPSNQQAHLPASQPSSATKARRNSYQNGANRQQPQMDQRSSSGMFLSLAPFALPSSVNSQHQSRFYVKWTEEEILKLINWWNDDTNFAYWSSRFKTHSYRQIAAIIGTKTTSQIKNKVDALIKSYNEAMGLVKEATQVPRKRETLTYSQIKAVCKYFEEMHTVFRKHSECHMEQVVLDQLRGGSSTSSAEDVHAESTTQPSVSAAAFDQESTPSTVQNLLPTVQSTAAASHETTRIGFNHVLLASPSINDSTHSDLGGNSMHSEHSHSSDGTPASSSIHAKLLALQDQELRTKQVMAELEIQRLKTWTEALRLHNSVFPACSSPSPASESSTQNHKGVQSPTPPAALPQHPSASTPPVPVSECLSISSLVMQAGNSIAPTATNPVTSVTTSMCASDVHAWTSSPAVSPSSPMIPAVQSLLPKSSNLFTLVQRQEFKARRALMELGLFRINTMLLAMEPPRNLSGDDVQNWKSEVQQRYHDVKRELERLRELLESKDPES